MPVRRSAVLVACALALLTAACDTDDGRDLPPAGPDQTLTIATSTTVAAEAAIAAGDGESSADASQTVATDDVAMTMTLPWTSGGVIPVDNTCTGADESPAIEWGGLPDGTVEVAIAVTDLTADEFVHWVAFGLDPASGGIAEGAAATLGGQAINGFGTVGYGGPCPPSGTHTYRFTVYALGQQLETPAGGPADEALAAIGAATLESTSQTGTSTAS